MYDLIIVGAGPAGITAAVYASRKKMNFLVVSKDLGGQPVLRSEVEKYMGYQFIAGSELVIKFQEHMNTYNFEFKLEEVAKVNKLNRTFEVQTNKGAYECRTLILASGKLPRKLNVPGEDLFRNRGVTYCATCDAPVFAGMDVAVVGGGNSALDAAIQLTNFAKKIYLVNIASKLGGDEILRNKILRSEKVIMLNNTRTLEVTGEKFVKGIKVVQEGFERTLNVGGVFIEIGSIPSIDYVKGLVKLNDSGEIEIDRKNRTSVDGIFAAGDVTDVPEKQIVIAAGEGAKAALSVYEYLTKLKS